MKAAAGTVRRIPPQTKRRIRSHSALIYRAHKEVPGMRNPDFLAGQLSFPKPVLLRLVSSEASRLSKTNRLKVITVQEIDAAVTVIQKKIRTKAALVDFAGLLSFGCLRTLLTSGC